jgi:hypothetical protein
MKKLLALIMVLGFAAISQAAIQLSINGVTDGSGNVTKIELQVHTTFAIGVISDDTADYSVYLDMDPQTSPGGYDLTEHGEWIPPMVICTAAGWDSSVEYYPDYQAWLVTAASFHSHNQPGKHFEIVYHQRGLEDDRIGVLITLFDSQWSTVLDQIEIHESPEPTTIGLLGLGGLALRRKRRA